MRENDLITILLCCAILVVNLWRFQQHLLANQISFKTMKWKVQQWRFMKLLVGFKPRVFNQAFQFSPTQNWEWKERQITDKTKKKERWIQDTFKWLWLCCASCPRCSYTPRLMSLKVHAGQDPDGSLIRKSCCRNIKDWVKTPSFNVVFHLT